MDLSVYSPSFLERRLLLRMRYHQVERYQDYVSVLTRDSGEFLHLLDSISINVTEFFRDAVLSEAVLRPLVAGLIERKPGDPFRTLHVWSAGCATGQEPYSVAMLLDAVLRAGFPQWQCSVVATDVKEAHLKAAREGLYPREKAAQVPPAYAARYFLPEEGGVRVREELRRRVQFMRHDLNNPPPVSRVDMILCRNVMIYFNAAAKGRLFGQFHRVLVPGGILILGGAEVILNSRLFQVVDERHKIYRKSDPAQAAPAR